MSERSHSTHTHLIPFDCNFLEWEDYTHTLENFGLECSTYSYSISFEKQYLEVFFVLYKGLILKENYHILSQSVAQHSC